ncbi:YibE/F family protein [Streptacidiphilus carbonis]|uniref:YibE/F family protein n=1 Tax=Streptacidiphilus carbonis TaxID=105422 RepID=UPI00069399C2|nr:YibE/F family protein [Streptacidiphilus carbonis]
MADHPHEHSHGHSHDHGPATPASRRLRRVIAAVLIPFAVAVVAGMVLMWPGRLPAHASTGLGFDQPTVSGRVTATRAAPCDAGATSTASAASTASSTAAQDACALVSVAITSGKDSGRTVRLTLTPDQTAVYSVGEKVVLDYSPTAPAALQYTIGDADRSMPMAILAGIFALAVVLVGRLRGLAALVALGISFAVLSQFVLPAILKGEDPLRVAVIGGGAIMLMALYLCHGLSARTSVAVLGTLVSLGLIGVLGEVFIGLTHLTGNTSDETALVHSLFAGIKLPGLLLAGVIIGSLGVLNDVTVTQASSVWELRAADPTMGTRDLYRAGIRIGRDHIASTVNTLVMAYAGAALPLMLLFTIANRGIWTVATSEIVAEEVVRTLVGSIGLIASVPLTTLLAAVVASHNGRPAAVSIPAPATAPATVPAESAAAAAAAGRHRHRR